MPFYKIGKMDTSELSERFFDENEVFYSADKRNKIVFNMEEEEPQAQETEENAEADAEEEKGLLDVETDMENEEDGLTDVETDAENEEGGLTDVETDAKNEEGGLTDVETDAENEEDGLLDVETDVEEEENSMFAEGLEEERGKLIKEFETFRESKPDGTVQDFFVYIVNKMKEESNDEEKID